VKLCMRDIDALSLFIDNNLQFKNGSQPTLFQSLEDIAGLIIYKSQHYLTIIAN